MGVKEQEAERGHPGAHEHLRVCVAAVNHGGHQSIVAAASLPPPDLRCTALLSNSGPELHSEEDPGKCSSHLATSSQSKTPQFHNVE